VRTRRFSAPAIGPAKGLTRDEAAVAAKAGLIEPDQRYWRTEEWQKGRPPSATASRKSPALRCNASRTGCGIVT